MYNIIDYYYYNNTRIHIHSGSIIAWDMRLPHSNALTHNGEEAREVVYASFLPDITKNRLYCQDQLRKYKSRLIPQDQWLRAPEKTEEEEETTFSELGAKLMGIEPWDE